MHLSLHWRWNGFSAFLIADISTAPEIWNISCKERFRAVFLLLFFRKTMANLDVKIKLANTLATLLLIGFQAFSYSNWYMVSHFCWDYTPVFATLNWSEIYLFFHDAKVHWTRRRIPRTRLCNHSRWNFAAAAYWYDYIPVAPQCTQR